MLNGELRLASLLLARCACQAGVCLPYAAEANKRSPRVRRSTFLLELIKRCPLLDKVGVVGEGYEDRWGWWSLRSF
jgi:hypothetical protein